MNQKRKTLALNKIEIGINDEYDNENCSTIPRTGGQVKLIIQPPMEMFDSNQYFTISWFIIFFSCESSSRNANVRLSVHQSVRPSVTESFLSL